MITRTSDEEKSSEKLASAAAILNARKGKKRPRALPLTFTVNNGDRKMAIREHRCCHRVLA